jgi:hypothetical protein
MKAGETNLKPAGSIVAAGHSVIDMERPINSGGKRFTQLGIIVKDDKRAAHRFEELFGISGWRFRPTDGLSNTYLNERPVAKEDIPSFTVDNANTLLGDIQLELLRPIGMKPGGCHQAFLDKHGNGFQHLNLGPRAGDYHITLDALRKAGFHAEFSTSLGEGNNEVSYIAMEEQLAGMVLEFGGKKVEE